jgi:hypothetical protein
LAARSLPQKCNACTKRENRKRMSCGAGVPPGHLTGKETTPDNIRIVPFEGEIVAGGRHCSAICRHGPLFGVDVYFTLRGFYSWKEVLL